MELDKKEIDEIFETSESQAEAFVRLYRLVYPNWDEIKHLKGHPKVSKEMQTYLFDKFIAFDAEHHPGVFNGGLWLDKGFSIDETLEGCTVIPADYEV